MEIMHQKKNLLQKFSGLMMDEGLKEQKSQEPYALSC